MWGPFIIEGVKLYYCAGNVSLFLTGGDALLVRDIDKDFRLVPDLVLHGLALACPLGDK